MSKQMIRKKEKGFFDEEYRRAELAKHRDPLKRLDAVMQWELFRPILEKCFDKPAKGPGGRPPDSSARARQYSQMAPRACGGLQPGPVDAHVDGIGTPRAACRAVGPLCGRFVLLCGYYCATQ